jgi:hypothetical protein
MDPIVKNVVARCKKSVDLNQVLDRPVTADKMAHDATAALSTFKQGFDSMEEIPSNLMPYYKQTMKAIDLLAKAAEETYQLRMMIRRMPR